ncbi:MAG: VOC family protein, partial [Acidobacteria bacterium]|nr:VOC family protein [Acidobacteriota bacterium]
MKGKLISAHGYQGDAMNLPVADANSAAAYYVEKMGFAIVGRGDEPHRKVVLERDGIQMALAENGGEPEQDGCAFHTDNIAALRDEFIAGGLDKIGAIGDDTQGGKKFKVFFVVAPDGLCYWFGEEQK